MISDKRNLIKEYAEAALVALDAQKKATETLIKSEKLVNAPADELQEKVYNSLHTDLENIQKVREKISKNDFNLSLFEINIVALAFYYQEQVFEKQITTLKDLISKTHQVTQALMAKEELN